MVAVLTWGASIAGFGVTRWLPLALLLLAVAGWADVLSAVFRNTIIQFAGPDGMRGRLMGVQMAVVAGGPRLGDLEAGAVATAFGDTVSVVSGGLACIAGALLLGWRLPGFTRLGSAGREPVPEAARATRQRPRATSEPAPAEAAFPGPPPGRLGTAPGSRARGHSRGWLPVVPGRRGHDGRHLLRRERQGELAGQLLGELPVRQLGAGLHVAGPGDRVGTAE